MIYLAPVVSMGVWRLRCVHTHRACTEHGNLTLLEGIVAHDDSIDSVEENRAGRGGEKQSQKSSL